MPYRQILLMHGYTKQGGCFYMEEGVCVYCTVCQINPSYCRHRKAHNVECTVLLFAGPTRSLPGQVPLVSDHPKCYSNIRIRQQVCSVCPLFMDRRRRKAMPNNAITQCQCYSSINVDRGLTSVVCVL